MRWMGAALVITLLGFAPGRLVLASDDVTLANCNQFLESSVYFARMRNPLVQQALLEELYLADYQTSDQLMQFYRWEKPPQNLSQKVALRYLLLNQNAVSTDQLTGEQVEQAMYWLLSRESLAVRDAVYQPLVESRKLSKRFWAGLSRKSLKPEIFFNPRQNLVVRITQLLERSLPAARYYFIKNYLSLKPQELQQLLDLNLGQALSPREYNLLHAREQARLRRDRAIDRLGELNEQKKIIEAAPPKLAKKVEQAVAMKKYVEAQGWDKQPSAMSDSVAAAAENLLALADTKVEEFHRVVNQFAELSELVKNASPFVQLNSSQSQQMIEPIERLGKALAERSRTLYYLARRDHRDELRSRWSGGGSYGAGGFFGAVGEVTGFMASPLTDLAGMVGAGRVVTAGLSGLQALGLADFAEGFMATSGAGTVKPVKQNRYFSLSRPRYLSTRSQMGHMELIHSRVEDVNRHNETELTLDHLVSAYREDPVAYLKLEKFKLDAQTKRELYLLELEYEKVERIIDQSDSALRALRLEEY